MSIIIINCRMALKNRSDEYPLQSGTGDVEGRTEIATQSTNKQSKVKYAIGTLFFLIVVLLIIIAIKVWKMEHSPDINVRINPYTLSSVCILGGLGSRLVFNEDPWREQRGTLL